jgi:hypothetical protein
MKKDKWLKWKIGVVASLGFALLFNQVKSSSAFVQASAVSTTGIQPTVIAMEKQDSVMDSGKTFSSQPSGSSSSNGSSSDSGSISRSQSDLGQSSPMTRNQTRTGRS